MPKEFDQTTAALLKAVNTFIHGMAAADPALQAKAAIDPKSNYSKTNAYDRLKTTDVKHQKALKLSYMPVDSESPKAMVYSAYNWVVYVREILLIVQGAGGIKTIGLRLSNTTLFRQPNEEVIGYGRDLVAYGEKDGGFEWFRNQFSLTRAQALNKTFLEKNKQEYEALLKLHDDKDFMREKKRLVHLDEASDYFGLEGVSNKLSKDYDKLNEHDKAMLTILKRALQGLLVEAQKDGKDKLLSDVPKSLGFLVNKALGIKDEQVGSLVGLMKANILNMLLYGVSMIGHMTKTDFDKREEVVRLDVATVDNKGMGFITYSKAKLRELGGQYDEVKKGILESGAESKIDALLKAIGSWNDEVAIKLAGINIKFKEINQKYSVQNKKDVEGVLKTVAKSLPMPAVKRMLGNVTLPGHYGEERIKGAITRAETSLSGKQTQLVRQFSGARKNLEKLKVIAIGAKEIRAVEFKLSDNAEESIQAYKNAVGEVDRVAGEVDRHKEDMFVGAQAKQLGEFAEEVKKGFLDQMTQRVASLGEKLFDITVQEGDDADKNIAAYQEADKKIDDVMSGVTNYKAIDGISIDEIEKIERYAELKKVEFSNAIDNIRQKQREKSLGDEKGLKAEIENVKNVIEEKQAELGQVREKVASHEAAHGAREAYVQVVNALRGLDLSTGDYKGAEKAHSEKLKPLIDQDVRDTQALHHLQHEIKKAEEEVKADAPEIKKMLDIIDEKAGREKIPYESQKDKTFVLKMVEKMLGDREDYQAIVARTKDTSFWRSKETSEKMGKDLKLFVSRLKESSVETEQAIKKYEDELSTTKSQREENRKTMSEMYEENKMLAEYAKLEDAFNKNKEDVARLEKEIEQHEKVLRGHEDKLRNMRKVKYNAEYGPKIGSALNKRSEVKKAVDQKQRDKEMLMRSIRKFDKTRLQKPTVSAKQHQLGRVAAQHYSAKKPGFFKRLFGGLTLALGIASVIVGAVLFATGVAAVAGVALIAAGGAATLGVGAPLTAAGVVQGRRVASEHDIENPPPAPAIEANKGGKQPVVSSDSKKNVTDDLPRVNKSVLSGKRPGENAKSGGKGQAKGPNKEGTPDQGEKHPLNGPTQSQE